MSDLNIEPEEKYDLERDNLAYRHSHGVRDNSGEGNHDEIRELWLNRIETSTDPEDIGFYSYMLRLKDMADKKMAKHKR